MRDLGGNPVPTWAALALLAIGSSAAAQPCSCPKYDLPAIVEGADAVFVGRVLSATDDAATPKQGADGNWSAAADYQRRVLLDVTDVLKGNVPRYAEVVTPTGPCVFLFVVGETYLVTANRAGAALSTNMCGANSKGKVMDDRIAMVREILGRPAR